MADDNGDDTDDGADDSTADSKKSWLQTLGVDWSGSSGGGDNSVAAITVVPVTPPPAGPPGGYDPSIVDTPPPQPPPPQPPAPQPPTPQPPPPVVDPPSIEPPAPIEPPPGGVGILGRIAAGLGSVSAPEVAIVAAGVVVGAVAPFAIGYAIEHGAEEADKSDPDDEASGHGIGGAPPQADLSPDGGAGEPQQAPGAPTTPSDDPDGGTPATTPGAPGNGGPASAPGAPGDAPADDPGGDGEPLSFAPDKLPPTADEFFDKVSKSKGPVVFRNLPADVIAQLKAKYGCDLAAGLQQMGTIASYEALQVAVAGCGNAFQAHHIVEQQILKLLGYPVDQCPAVILTTAEHIAVTQILAKLIPNADIDDMTKKQILQGYAEAYKDHPAWISEVRRYFSL